MTAQRINARDFLTLHNSKKTTVLDLRSPAEVSREYINHCEYLPLQQLTHDSFRATLQNRLNNGSQKVYLLCQSGMRADAAVRQMGEIGGVEWVVVEGGLNAIKTAGGHVNKGSRKIIPLERQVRIAAGLVILGGVVLGSLINPAFFLLSGVVGAGLIFAGITDRCGLAFVLTRMPWNQ